MLDGETFSPVRYIKQDGLISAIYELYSEDKAVFSFKNRPVIGFLDTKISRYLT